MTKEKMFFLHIFIRYQAREEIIDDVDRFLKYICQDIMQIFLIMTGSLELMGFNHND